MNYQPDVLSAAAEMLVLLTPVRFTFTQVKNQHFYLPQTYFSIHTSTKVQNASTFTISGVGLAQVCKAEHTRRDDRSKWVDQWMGFATDGFCSPRCSKKEEELFTATTKKNGNTTKTAEKGSRNISVIQISCVTSKETIYLSLFHLIGSSFSKIAVWLTSFCACRA